MTQVLNKIELIESCRPNKVQVYRFVRINNSSHCDLLLNSHIFSIPVEAENPSLSQLCYRRLWGSQYRRTLILGYYLDAFSNYLLHTWQPNVYRGHDNWHTEGESFPIFSY
ncbi:hypothetical protein GLYMA_06G274000v4 [Glycine max]|uniref:Uncharacterized protein n=1 Tax=Glycine max TaxID=3847 RepID=A0A0R0JM75_SOYBN|nr:hypothetical protein GLYMA_06G274000v4 [Glycine max]